MKAAIDYKKANSELTGVDTFEGAGRYMNEFDYMEV